MNDGRKADSRERERVHHIKLKKKRRRKIRKFGCSSIRQSGATSVLLLLPAIQHFFVVYFNSSQQKIYI
jgi:hypothetical protein